MQFFLQQNIQNVFSSDISDFRPSSTPCNFPLPYNPLKRSAVHAKLLFLHSIVLSASRYGWVVSSIAPAFYEIEPGTAPFAILGDSGTIVATNTGQGTYTFIVHLMDQFLQRTSATAIVQVQCPTTSSRATFQQPAYQFGPVCQAGTAVGMVSLTNPPPGTRYFMTPPLTGLLNLDPTTGSVNIKPPTVNIHL